MELAADGSRGHECLPACLWCRPPLLLGLALRGTLCSASPCACSVVCPQAFQREVVTYTEVQTEQWSVSMPCCCGLFSNFLIWLSILKVRPGHLWGALLAKLFGSLEPLLLANSWVWEPCRTELWRIRNVAPSAALHICLLVGYVISFFSGSP